MAFSSSGVRIAGLRELQIALAALSPVTQKELVGEFRKAARTVADEAKRRVPVRSGALRSSIGVRASRQRAGIKAGSSGVEYAPVIEFGGRHPVFGTGTWVDQPAQPFLRPAVEDKHKEILKAAEEAVADAIRKVGL